MTTSNNYGSNSQLLESTTLHFLPVIDFNAIRQLETNLLDELMVIYEKEKLISDDLLESLYFVYKNPLLEALNQIDKFDAKAKSTNLFEQIENNCDLVTLIKCETVPNRCIYQVKGSLGINYYLFESLNYCACSSFKYNVLNKNEFIYCKHMVLVKLLKAMNKIDIRFVKESELVDLIKQI